MKYWKRSIKLVFLLSVFWFLGHTAYTITDGLSDEGKKADVAVILGNKVNEDGTLSKRLEQRLICGLDLYNKRRVKKIIVSGGLGKEGFYEGTKMRKYLIEKNVPDTAILVDNLGNNTLATVKNTIRLKDSLHFEHIIAVSQYFHLTRTKMLFRKNGIKNISSVSPRFFEIRDIYSIIREFASYYTSF